MSAVSAAEEAGWSAEARTKPRQGEAVWARALRLMVLLAAAILLAAGMIDSLTSWKIDRTLSSVAGSAARMAISSPLDAKNCGGTPCSIESAAAAAKRRLMNAGYGKASCIDPRNPTFSGVLVWEFACASGARAVEAGEANTQPGDRCDTSEPRVCVKIDMTPSEIEADHQMVGYTRATVQYPRDSAVAFLLRLVPERLRPPMPKSVADSAMVRDPF